MLLLRPDVELLVAVGPTAAWSPPSAAFSSSGRWSSGWCTAWQARPRWPARACHDPGHRHGSRLPCHLLHRRRRRHGGPDNPHRPAVHAFRRALGADKPMADDRLRNTLSCVRAIARLRDRLCRRPVHRRLQLGAVVTDAIPEPPSFRPMVRLRPILQRTLGTNTVQRTLHAAPAPIYLPFLAWRRVRACIDRYFAEARARARPGTALKPRPH